MPRPRLLLRFALAVWLTILGSTPVHAGWLGFRNDSNQVLLVQTGVVVDNRPSWNKPQKLYPGEVAWESIAGKKELICQVALASQPDKPILQQAISFEGKDLFFSVQVEQPPPKKKGEAPPPPKVKLVAATPPTRDRQARK